MTVRNYKLCSLFSRCTDPKHIYSFSVGNYYVNSLYDYYPVVNITWEQARNYCEKRGARLPTEAEWEKAARGGFEQMDYQSGNSSTEVKANFCDRRCPLPFANLDLVDNWVDTSEIGYYPANSFGIYDMTGNVWEWVADFYEEKYYSISPKQNPTGPVGGDFHVMRGGAWSSPIEDLRVANRAYGRPDLARYDIGFRCVRDP